MLGTPEKLEPDVEKPVPFYSLGPQHVPLFERFRARLDEIMADNVFIGGPQVEKFEQQWADYCGATNAIGVANGTDAIELTLRGMGIGQGDEVLVPANTFVATAEAVVATGASPVFVDVDPGSLLISESSVLAAISSRTAAVIVVHLYGHVADVGSITEIARRHGLAVIEDAAQAHGARFGEARVGSLGHAAAFSFYPGKNLGALGDGGAVTTDDQGLARRIRVLANHGRSNDRHEHVEIGRNSRLDSMQAAFLSEKLPYLDAANDRRRALAAGYAARLCDTAILVPTPPPGTESVYHLMAVQVEGRDRFRERLADRGIATAIHYRSTCHRQPAFERYAPGYLPIAERAAARIVSLPMFPTMTDRQLERTCDAIDLTLNERRP